MALEGAGVRLSLGMDTDPAQGNAVLIPVGSAAVER